MDNNFRGKAPLVLVKTESSVCSFVDDAHFGIDIVKYIKLFIA